MDNQKGTSINFEKFTWKIENFSKQNIKKLQSKAFRIRGYKWQIRLFPLMKNVDHFSLYLMVADSLPPYGWSRSTYFKLALINQLDGSKSVVKETQQKFNGGYRSWGSFFVNLSDFYDSKQGYLVNNTCIIEAHVCVSDFSTLEANNYLNKITPTNDSKLGDQAARSSESTQQEDDKETETEASDESETLSSSATCGSSQTEGEVQGSDLTLKDLLDLESLGKEEAAFVPLLEEACIWHPSLIRSQRKSSRWFKLWAFTSLGQVLHLLKTNKVKDMNEDACNRLQCLWDELVKHSGFQLSWLEPYVKSALGMKAHLEKTAEVNKLKDSVVALEIRMKKLRGELAAAEAEFEVARKALAEARKGFIEMDLNAELGYSMF
ncbi:Ubiquitin carboxyl-terminal hydrolase 12 [Spatholobus suberectus]|nr:Ubiquitin carboxyl-terminal hydrolase 12 [Spatholobus suberectus]